MVLLMLMIWVIVGLMIMNVWWRVILEGKVLGGMVKLVLFLFDVSKGASVFNKGILLLVEFIV